MIGQALEHFVLLDRLGAGGMRVVYRARDERLEREVAIKLLPAESFDNPGSRARLLREARIAANLNHPNICTVYEVGEAEDQAFIAMELVEGRPLSALLAKGRLPARQVLHFGRQLADALAHAHDHGVIHRDFKSANVVVTPAGRVKVLDFGLATRVSNVAISEATTDVVDSSLTGKVVGTVPYMAPEQFHGFPPDARSDIWALGVVLYEMAAARRPFQGSSGVNLISAILTQTPAPLTLDPSDSVSAQLLAIVERCLEKEPGQRYQHAAEVRAALEMLQSTSSAPVAHVEEKTRPRRWLTAAAGVMMLAIVALGFVVSRQAPLRVPASLASAEAAETNAAVRTIAVLPVVNLSANPSEEYFSDGMTDALITAISRVSAIRVTSRMSIMRYKGKLTSLPGIRPIRWPMRDSLWAISTLRMVRRTGRIHSPARKRRRPPL